MKGVQAEAQTCAYRNTSVRRLALYRMARFLDIKIGMILVFWYASISINDLFFPAVRFKDFSTIRPGISYTDIWTGLDQVLCQNDVV